MSNTIEVEKPKALEGDNVTVLNYRSGADSWETGKVLAVTSKWVRDEMGGVDLVHDYFVQLDRESRNGNTVNIHLNDKQIK